MLSQTCKTAIKAVIYLAGKEANEEKTGLREIAEQISASEHTVGKVLQTLVRHGLINSLKGPSGGFSLTEEQRQLPVFDFVITIEGPQIFKECGLGLSKCSETHPCPIHNEYKAARELLEKIFKEKRVCDLCERVSDGVAFLIG